MTEMEKQTQEVLALAWSLLNDNLWYARQKMETYIKTVFVLKTQKETQHDKAND
jgi:hypothetical protein